jgi:hypothetical protein
MPLTGIAILNYLIIRCKDTIFLSMSNFSLKTFV